MIREHAPLIAVAAIFAIVFYLVFRDLRSLRADVKALAAAAATAADHGQEPLEPQDQPQPRPLEDLPLTKPAGGDRKRGDDAKPSKRE